MNVHDILHSSKNNKPYTYVTKFYEPYILDRLHNEHSVPVRLNDTVLLVDTTLLTIEYFEQEVEIPSTSYSDEIKTTVFMVGTRFLRFRFCEDLGGFLASDPREVYMSSRGRHDVSEIYRKVRLIKTNRIYPQFKSQSPLTFVCRYRRTEGAVIRLSSKQADPGPNRHDDNAMRHQFISENGNFVRRALGSRYTYGDAFSGAGGCSAGARMAGLEIKWAFDADPEICEVYSQNFPSTNVIAASVDKFLELKCLGNVDVLHLSPPCQTWSQAHTNPGRNDDANSAALFSVYELLKAHRPRIATLEQVTGLIRLKANKYARYPCRF
jgi:hypothetical protein